MSQIKAHSVLQKKKKKMFFPHPQLIFVVTTQSTFPPVG